MSVRSTGSSWLSRHREGQGVLRVGVRVADRADGGDGLQHDRQWAGGAIAPKSASCRRAGCTSRPDDLDATLAKIADLGGKPGEAAPVSGWGRIAHCEDSTRARRSACSSGVNCPAGLAQQAGTSLRVCPRSARSSNAQNRRGLPGFPPNRRSRQRVASGHRSGSTPGSRSRHSSGAMAPTANWPIMLSPSPHRLGLPPNTATEEPLWPSGVLDSQLEPVDSHQTSHSPFTRSSTPRTTR